MRDATHHGTRGVTSNKVTVRKDEVPAAHFAGLLTENLSTKRRDG